MAGSIKVAFDAKGMGEKLRVRTQNFTQKQTKAVQAAANRAADEIETEGRANIRAGGNFGSARWQEGFQAKVSYQSRNDIRVRATHAVSYWRVFEYGAKIFGKPLLWIPLSFGQAKTRARDFPGKLFRVNRKHGAPLLMNENGPQYVGKESVTIPRKWRLRDVTRRVSKKLGAYYRDAMRGTNG
jgi:hypothetical protein